MSWWNRLFGGGPDLTGRAVAALAGAWPELRFERGEPGVILVRQGDREPAIASTAVLDQRVAQLGEEAGFKSWLEDPQHRRMFDVMGGRSEMPTITREGLLPRLITSSRFASLDQPPEHEEILPGVWLTVVWQHPDWGTRYLGKGELEDLAMSFADAKQLAMAHIDEHVRGKPLQGVHAEGGGAALLVLDDTHAAAALLSPRLRGAIAASLGSPFLVMIPQTDELIAAPREPRDRDNRRP